ncbi:MAG: aminopeptidase [Chitinophagaceae bacterium]|nr:aminopeptidase [Chitinophagaceae bacterium]
MLPLVVLVFLICCKTASVPKGEAVSINAKEVARIETVLSDDNMQGRKAGTPGIDKAADFIAQEFRGAGLELFPGLSTYKQEFSMLHPKHVFTAAVINGSPADQKDVIVVTQRAGASITEASGYEKVYIKAGQNLFAEARKYVGGSKNYLIVVDTSHRKNFGRLTGYRRPSFPSPATQVFMLTENEPQSFSVTSRHNISVVKMANVIGVLPGKSKKDEFVVFSAHHDHIGIGKPTPEGDSIYNGANDDAAGTTAVIMLARHFRAMNDNERTLVFVTFTAEEMGGFGSQYFSKQLDPAKVMAMFNIEMIGTESKWGKNSAYITGYDKTDMGAILQKNLEGTGFTFHPDPYPKEELFLRSDNATLARLGVPAHTISTSKMDIEKYYHTADDEIGTLDMENMAAIIRAIAMSSKGIVSGKETPTRVKN